MVPASFSSRLLVARRSVQLLPPKACHRPAGCFGSLPSRNSLVRLRLNQKPQLSLAAGRSLAASRAFSTSSAGFGRFASLGWWSGGLLPSASVAAYAAMDSDQNPQREEKPSDVSDVTESVAENLERSSLDNRQYKVIRLPNKLEILLIHDPDTDKASAALDVNTGSYSDDRELPGMAHAVEHLLFMGTKKYPVENEYNDYLTKHSGYSNAYTSSTETNYYFEIAARSESEDGDQEPPLYGALDRFSQFFVEPLFLEDTVDRELRAVDSEHKKNLQLDTWRMQQLGRSLANPEHPMSKFSTGNLQTLRDEPLAKGVPIRQEFIKFYEREYSANRMKLVVLGREPLEKLQEWVESLFSDVPNKNLEPNRWDGVPPYSENELKKLIFAKPVMDMRTLNLTFVYQDEMELCHSQPERYLSHLTGHEGPGSILAYIKGKGWANGLSAGTLQLCPGSSLFKVTVDLTPEGLKEYQQIIKTVFSYWSILRETEPQEWVFEEMKNMGEVDFRFKQKSPASSTTSGLASDMQNPHLPREWLLSNDYKIREFNPEGIKSGLTYLNPDNVRITITSKTPLEGDVKQEQWYGTEYTIDNIAPEFLSELRSALESTVAERPRDLFLPHKNEFIPTRFDVEKKQGVTPSVAPKIIRNDEHVRLWWKKDDQFWVPKANVEIYLRNPFCSASARAVTLTRLFVDLVRDELVEYAYDAELAGLDYSISSGDGILVSISGYNDKISVLLEKVLTSVRDINISDDRFAIIKDRNVRTLENFGYSMPYHQIGQYARWISVERGWSPEQLLDETPTVSAEDVREFKTQILSQNHIEALVHGNLYREDALKLANVIETVMRARKLPPSQWPSRRSLMFPPGKSYQWTHELKDPANINHCVEYILPICDVKDRDTVAKLRLLAQIASEPAFNILRSQEQLGYVVFSGDIVQGMTAGYRVLIQSERHPQYLEERIDNFLGLVRKNLESMSATEFDSHKRSVISALSEKLKNLGQESGRFWRHITTELYHFEKNEEDVQQTKPITKDQILQFFDQYINPSSQTRSKLSVHLIAKAGTTAPDGASPVKDPAAEIEDVTRFKASVPLSISASPMKDLTTYEDLESKL